LLVRLRTDDRLPIDHEGWRALHAKLLGSAGFLLDDAGVLPGIQALVEGCGVQAELYGEAFQVVLAEGALIFAVLLLEQQIVIFPELILIGGALAGFRRPLRLIPQECKMPVSKANLTRLDVFIYNLATRASGKSAAVWSLKVAKLDHGDRGVLVAKEMA
jgi:hypothetical protein